MLVPPHIAVAAGVQQVQGVAALRIVERVAQLANECREGEEKAKTLQGVKIK
jgi:hypothetical protein